MDQKVSPLVLSWFAIIRYAYIYDVALGFDVNDKSYKTGNDKVVN